MIGKGAHNIRPATLSEVAKILEKRQGTAGEFGFEQQTSLSYAEKFSHLKLSDAQAMMEELVELGLKAETAAKVVDLLPRNKNQLMLILSKDKTDLSEKKMGELEAAIAKFAAKAKNLDVRKEEPAAAAEGAAPKEGEDKGGKEAPPAEEAKEKPKKKD